MAQLAYLERNWSTVYHMVEEALKIRERPASYINEAFSWDATIYDLGALSCYEMGMFHKSYEWAKVASEMSPNVERLKRNLEIIKSKVDFQQ